MSMSSHSDEDDSAPISEMNVTPLVDVMLVLLIIFMVTAPLMLSQLPLQLPKASLEDMGKPPDPLIVSLDHDGNYYLDLGGGHVEQLTLASLPTRLHQIAVQEPDNLLYIRGDKDAQFDKVRDILKMAAAAGFYKVSLVSEAPQ